VIQSHWSFPDSKAVPRKADRTPVGKALTACGLNFTTVDLSSAEEKHWEKRVNLLQALRPAFEAEGARSLFEQRFSEACSFHLWPSEYRSRHLFVADV